MTRVLFLMSVLAFGCATNQPHLKTETIKGDIGPVWNQELGVLALNNEPADGWCAILSKDTDGDYNLRLATISPVVKQLQHQFIQGQKDGMLELKNVPADGWTLRLYDQDNDGVYDTTDIDQPPSAFVQRAINEYNLRSESIRVELTAP